MKKLQTTNDIELEFNKDKNVEQVMIIPFQDLLLSMKLVEKDKDRKTKTPYVKIEIVVPNEIGTTINEVMNSKWKLALLGVQYKPEKAKKMQYKTEEERLDEGLCPECETDLVKASHNGGSHDDKHSVCPNKKCGWEDSE